jgi:hypothetical protein
MRTRILSLLLVALVIVLSTVVGRAHHAVGAIYRLDEQRTIEGVVVALVYRSPHSFLHVKALDESKHMRVWAVECGTAEQLRHQVMESSLKPGDDLIVTGDVARDEGSWRLRLRSLLRPSDGWRWKETVR